MLRVVNNRCQYAIITLSDHVLVQKPDIDGRVKRFPNTDIGHHVKKTFELNNQQYYIQFMVSRYAREIITCVFQYLANNKLHNC
jgi:hypothetical protein